MKSGTRGRLLLAAVASTLIFAPVARASDTWVVCFRTNPIHYQGEPDCESLAWQDKLFFYNSNPGPVVVRLLGVSGRLDPRAQDITIGVGSSFAVSGSSAPLFWDPCAFTCSVTIFAAHLDIPDGVVVSSRAEAVGYEVVPSDTICPADFRARVFAGLPLPVRRHLTPAGVPQYHLGIDTGTDTNGDTGPAADARTSIGIYNQASATASATIETRRGCDDAVIERRVVTVPPNSVIQFSGFSSDTSGCGASLKAPHYAAYAVVTVDQPSFSYAIALRSDTPPAFVGTAPITQ